jgi:hypothetical protein
VAKGPPPAWNRRDCSFDHLVRAAVVKGYGRVLVYGGIEDIGRAHEIRKGIYRCARHRKLTADAGPSSRLAGGDEMGIRKTGRTYELRYRIFSKRTGKKSVLDRHGPDRSKWPYDPRRPANAAERESWAARDERGRPVTH